MHIGFVIARFYPFRGGAEQYTFELAVRAVADGHQVTVFTTNLHPTGEKLPTEEIYQGIKIVRVPAWNKQLNLGFYPKLLSALVKTNLDVIHVTNGPGFIWRDLCLLIKKLFSWRTKFITTPHGPFLATPETHSGLKKLIARIGKLVMAPYFILLWRNLFELFLQDNPKQHVWMQREYLISPNKIALIPIGISADYVETALPPKPAVINITFLARIEKYKGAQHLISAASKLINQTDLPKFQINIAGKPGPVYPELKELTQFLELTEVVHFSLTPPDNVRDEIMLNTHIFVLPSQWEAAGIVLMEAMAKGAAIITTYQNESAELLITPGKNGFIYQYGDVDTLASYLKQLLENSDLLAHMQQENLKRVYNFTWEAIYPHYAQILNQLVKHKH
jgi:glycosyltransferase involved in cell wall biosynthesis